MNYKDYKDMMFSTKCAIGAVGLIVTLICFFAFNRFYLASFVFFNLLLYLSEILYFRKYGSQLEHTKLVKGYKTMSIPMLYMLTVFALVMFIFFIILDFFPNLLMDL